MSNVIDMWEWRRTRRGEGGAPVRRVRGGRYRANGKGSSFVRLGTVSGEIVRLLKE
jgi:hypothetical protein